MDDTTPDIQTVLDRLERAEARIAQLERENQTLREENERLREENERLRGENERLRKRVQQLEHKLGQNSSNSHLPPSTDDPWEDKEDDDDGDDEFTFDFGGDDRAQGAQPGHEGRHRELLDADEVDHIVDVKPCECTDCGAQLTGDDDVPWRHQVFEIKVIRQVTEYRMHRLRCGECGHDQRAELPEHVPNSAFGDRLCTWVSWMTGQFDLSKRDAQRMVQEGFDIPISLGSICALERRAQSALAPAYDEAVMAIGQSDVLWVDETGWFEQNERNWLWVAVGDDELEMTVFHIDPSRSRAALEELVDEDYPGIVSSDRYSAYNGREPEKRQICWQHLIRDFRGLAARDGPAADVARTMLAMAFLIFFTLSLIRDERYSRAKLERRVDEVWRPAILQILTEAANRDDAPGIFENLRDREAALWTFAYVEGVEPTNNRAERAVRPGVIKRKLSFGTQSGDGSRFIERMLTVCETLRRQGRDVLDFLTESIEAMRARSAPPSLVPKSIDVAPS